MTPPKPRARAAAPPPAEPVEFPPEVIREDGRNRVDRTTGQVTTGAALVTVGEWLAQQLGWDGSVPTVVAGAIVVLIARAASRWSNRERLAA